MVHANGRPATKTGPHKPLLKKPVLPVAQPLPTSTKTAETLVLNAQDDALNALFSELGL